MKNIMTVVEFLVNPNNIKTVESKAPPYSEVMEMVVLTHFALHEEVYYGNESVVELRQYSSDSHHEKFFDNMVISLVNGMSPLVEFKKSMFQEPHRWQQFVRGYFYMHCAQTFNLIQQGVTFEQL